MLEGAQAGIFALFVILQEKFSLTNEHYAHFGFFIYGFYNVEVVYFYSYSIEYFFIWKGCWILPSAFSVSIKIIMCFSFLFFVDMTYYIDWCITFFVCWTIFALQE